MFYGVAEDLPENWKICDGQRVDDPLSPLNGQTLPDLRGRFVRGAMESTVGTQGGADTYQQTHSHGMEFEVERGRTIQQGLRFQRILWRSGRAALRDTPVSPGLVNPGYYVPVYSWWTPRSVTAGPEFYQHSHAIPRTIVRGNSDGEEIGHDNRPRYTELHYIIRVR